MPAPKRFHRVVGFTSARKDEQISDLHTKSTGEPFEDGERRQALTTLDTAQVALAGKVGFPRKPLLGQVALLPKGRDSLAQPARKLPARTRHRTDGRAAPLVSGCLSGNLRVYGLGGDVPHVRWPVCEWRRKVHVAIRHDMFVLGGTMKERIAAALVAPDGRVVSVIAIASATDTQIQAAKRHAAAQGFNLIIQETVDLCVDDDQLRNVILEDRAR